LKELGNMSDGFDLDTESAPHISGAGPNRFLARQPILDRTRRLIGYELLFRSGWANSFGGEPEDATQQILDNILVSGSRTLCSHTLSFVNCTRDSLVRGLVTLLPPTSTVLEILEDIKPDEDVISACRSLKEMGYRLALDDFALQKDSDKLIQMADYIKIDFRASGVKERQAIRDGVRESTAILVAEKIENEAEFNTAVAEGFTLFQGYFFCRPTIIPRHEVPMSRAGAMQLLIELSRPTLDFRKIERVVMANTPLCYRLLRMANSALYALHQQVESVRQALTIVGEVEFRKLALISLNGIVDRHDSDTLLLLSLQRACFCELVAPFIKQNPEEQYLIGLLSAVDAMMEIPMTTIVDALPLRQPVRFALLGGTNSESRGIRLARRFETGDWNWTAEDDERSCVSEFQLALLYAQSVDRANRTQETMETNYESHEEPRREATSLHP